MKHYWLNKKDQNNKLILFFNGWGMNETPIQHLICENYDILMMFDYVDFEFDFKQFDFSKYIEKNLICWSMGVYVSNMFINFLSNFDKKIAINGTNKIIDNNYGINEKIYTLTVKLFNETSCSKFIENMFNNKIPNNINITKSLESLKKELVSLKNLKTDNEILFDIAIISKKDKIIPSKNQIAYWRNKTNIIQINAPHCPFSAYSKWSELLC